jgi:hypothetical protein
VTPIRQHLAAAGKTSLSLQAKSVTSHILRHTVTMRLLPHCRPTSSADDGKAVICADVHDMRGEAWPEPSHLAGDQWNGLSRCRDKRSNWSRSPTTA